MAIIVTRATSALVAGTGTITTSTSSTTVTGSGTLFTTEVDYVGKALYTSADVYIGTVASIASNTSLTLSANAAVAVSGGGYKHGYLPKNNPLSNAEIDTNFINLNNNKLEVTDTSAVNLANTVVRRDGSGNFAAGTITATLSGTATQVSNSLTAGTGLSGSTFNGASAQTWSLATSGVTAGSYGSSTAIPVITVDTYGRITLASTSSVSTTITLAAGSGSGTVAGGGTLTLSGGTGVATSVTGSTYTLSIGQAVATSSNVQFNSLGVGTAASGTAGEIRATNNITSWYSDQRLKENITLISNALEKLCQLDGVTFNANNVAEEYGFTDKSKQVGVLAQQVEKVLPEAVKPAPFDIMLYEDTEISRSGQNYKTVQYEKLVPLLIQAVKELNEKVEKVLGDK